MYLETGDIIAVIIALTVSVFLVATTAIRNWQLTEGRNYWRSKYYEAVSKP